MTDSLAVPPDMRDGLTNLDATWLFKIAANAAEGNKESPILVEVGSWKGHSTSIIGKIALLSKGHIFCVDHWKGNFGVWHYAQEKDGFDAFRTNMKKFGMGDVVHPMLMKSALAATIFRDGIVDMVFLDADHRYESILHDIKAWWPKLKSGGILCGHDCEGYYHEYPLEYQELIDSSLDVDYVWGAKCHPGVIKALYECFGRDYELRKGSTIWFKVKE